MRTTPAVPGANKGGNEMAGQMQWLRRAALAGALVVGGAGAATLVSAQSAQTQTLRACVNPNSGDMKLVQGATSCKNNEQLVTWNVQGPKGDPGPKGAPG